MSQNFIWLASSLTQTNEHRILGFSYGAFNLRRNSEREMMSHRVDSIPVQSRKSKADACLVIVSIFKSIPVPPQYVIVSA